MNELITVVDRRMSVRYDIGCALHAVLKRLHDANEKIMALKLLRAAVPGMGLAEAKLIFEVVNDIAYTCGTLEGYLTKPGIGDKYSVRVEIFGPAQYWEGRQLQTL